MRVNGLDEGQVCVTIRKVIGTLGRAFLLAVTHTQLQRVLRSHLVSRARGSIHEPSCHTNTFFCTPIFVHSPDHLRDLLCTYLKTQLQESVELQDDSWGLTLILLTWKIWWAPNNASRWQMGFNSAFKGLNWTGCGRKQRILPFTVMNFLIPYKAVYSLVRRETIRNSRCIPDLQS